MKPLQNILLFILCLFAIQTNAQTFTDRLTDEVVGEAPSKWNVIAGAASVGTQDGEKVILLDNQSIITPEIGYHSYLEDNFTLKFQAYFDDVEKSMIYQNYKIRFWEGKTNYRLANNIITPLSLYRFRGYMSLSLSNNKGNRETINYKESIKELEGREGVWRQVTINYKAGTLKVIMDGFTIFEIPNVTFTPSMISIEGEYVQTNNEHIRAIKNISVSGLSELSSDTENSCGAIPTQEQLAVLKDPTSLFNKRLKFLENYTVEDLRGVATVQYINGQFVLPQQVRFTTSPTENYTVVPIAAHILRKSNHTEGLALNDLHASINRANNLFDKYGVYLHLDKIKFIDNDDIYKTNINDTIDSNNNNTRDYIELLGIRNKNIANKLNIYFAEKSYTSWANFPDTSNKKQHIIMQNGQTRNESTLIHEIGHWFNLMHTHETNTEIEDVSGENCSTAGDLCCDTPADPKLGSNVDTNCNYTGNETDDSGENYNPDPTNIMSYSRKKCRDNFSNEQINRMYNAYLGMEQDRGYTLEVNKEIGEKIQTLSLNPGYKAVQHFETAGKSYMIYFNNQTSEITINKLNNNGTRGQQVDYKNFRGDMSFVTVFNRGKDRYLIMINYSTGELGIIKLNTNGTMGAGQSYYVENGCNNAIIKGDFLALFNYNTEKVTTYNITSNGRLGARKYKTSDYFNYKYDKIEVFGKNIVCYNSQLGDATLGFIGEDGVFTDKRKPPRFLDKNWTELKYVPQPNNYGNTMGNILILNKENGQIKQYHWTESKKIGENWYDSAKIKGNLQPGFDVITPYYVNDGNIYQYYAMVSNSTKGKIMTYHLNNNM